MGGGENWGREICPVEKPLKAVGVVTSGLFVTDIVLYSTGTVYHLLP